MERAGGLRIALVSVAEPDAATGGGLGNHFHHLIGVLGRLGASGTVFLPRASGQDASVSGFDVIRIDSPPGRQSRLWWRRLAKAFQEEHAQRPFDLFISEAPSGWSLFQIPADRRCPGIYWGHGFHPEHFVNEWNNINSLRDWIRYPLLKVPEVSAFTWIERDCVRRAQFSVGVADHIAESYRTFYRPGDQKVRSVANWVDTDFFAPDEKEGKRTRSQMGAGDADTVILMAAHLSRQKGVHLGLASAARVVLQNPVKIWVAGGGEQLQSLKQQAKELGIEGAVRWLGPLSSKDIKSYYQAADIFLMPTLRLEGMSYTLLEALACGLPIVATDRGGNQQTVGEAGLVVPACEEDIGDVLLELVSDPARRRALAAAARARALKEYAPQVAKSRIDSLLCELPSASRPTTGPRR